MTRDLNEPVLEDDYPVYSGYYYVADGSPIQSPIAGTVRDLKQIGQYREIRRCDAVGRGLPL